MKAVAQAAQSLGLTGRQFVSAGLTGFPKSNHTGHVHRPRAESPLLSSSFELRYQPNSGVFPPREQGALSLGAIHLVCRYGEKIDAQIFHVQGYLARGLGGVALPAGLGRVTLRGHDSVHGYGGVELTVELPE